MRRKYKVKSIDCANCAAKMETAIKKLDGVNDININFLTQTLVLDADEDAFCEIIEQIKRIIDKIEPGTVLVC